MTLPRTELPRILSARRHFTPVSPSIPAHQDVLLRLTTRMTPASCATVAAAAALAAVLAAVACRGERTFGANADRADEAQARGLEYLRLEALDSAEREFRNQIALAPRLAAGHTNLGLALLRGGRTADAEAAARRAWTLDSNAVTTVLLLARVRAELGRPDDARDVLARAVARMPEDPALLYALAMADSTRRTDLLQRIVARTPTNLAARVALLQALIAAGRPDSAARTLEEVRRLPPEPPPEAMAHYRLALRSLRTGRIAAAREPVARFARSLELTPTYQAGLALLKGPEGPRAGRPLLRFSPGFVVQERARQFGRTIRDRVRFSDATASRGLDTAAGAGRGMTAVVAIADVDGDGITDLFANSWDAARRTTVPRLYRGTGERYEALEGPWRVALSGGVASAAFADVDNDGRLDLLVTDSAGRAHLFRNAGRRRFDDITAAAGLTGVAARKAVFADLDHDGDLDLLTLGPAGLHAMRNNGYGTLVEATDAFGLTRPGDAADAAFGDFDGDGRLDVIVTGEGRGITLFRNAGARRFQDATVASGLAEAGARGPLAVGDFDNDGALDVFIAGAESGPALWRNRGDGSFARDRRSADVWARIRAMQLRDVKILDHDNDGWLDLALVGRPASDSGRGVVLLANDGSGRFVDRTSVLPDSPRGADAVTVADIDDDGDEDLVVADAASGPRVLRNDGGNANLFVQVRLAGLRTGSGKNNVFGIGSRIELRAGELVQTRVVTGPVTHFGLGPHLKADVVRVEWTNGVPQLIYLPGSDQDVLENEVLKGSCAFLYAWDGDRFRFVTDVMWRSALGMPMGIMGGTTAWAPAAASQEFLRIPGAALRERDGVYTLQFTEELWETAFADEVRLVAVDHPDSVAVFVDERFVPPAPVTLRLYRFVRRVPPRSAVDDRGTDVLAALRDKDDVYVSDLVPLAFQGLVEPHGLVLDLGDAAGHPGSALVLRGWIYPTDASINVALSQQSRIRPVLPALEVRDARGAWRRAADVGFPSGKDKTVIVDLAGLFPTRDHHVRLRTNMQIYWDQAFVGFEATDTSAAPARLTTAALESAHLHFRGTSRTYRKGGRFGPHWFDYDSVITRPVWRPITGAFTRFGDVRPLLESSDDRYVIMGPGDEATLRFRAPPQPPAGWTRDFLLFTDGWIKDADMNTAFGNTVEPLPFHAARSYPHAPGEGYPSDAAHARYRREFNTRVVRGR